MGPPKAEESAELGDGNMCRRVCSMRNLQHAQKQKHRELRENVSR